MKVQIIKKGTVAVNAKPQGWCAAMIDDAPMNKK